MWQGSWHLVIRKKVEECGCIVSNLDVSLLPHSWAVQAGPLVSCSLRYTFRILKHHRSVMTLVVGHSGCLGRNTIEDYLSPGRLRAEWPWVCTSSQEGSPGLGECWRFCVHNPLWGWWCTYSSVHHKLSWRGKASFKHLLCVHVICLFSLTTTFSKDSKGKKKAGEPVANIFCPMWDMTFKLCFKLNIFLNFSLFLRGNTDLFQIFIISKARAILYLVFCSWVLQINWIWKEPGQKAINTHFIFTGIMTQFPSSSFKSPYYLPSWTEVVNWLGRLLKIPVTKWTPEHAKNPKGIPNPEGDRKMNLLLKM